MTLGELGESGLIRMIRERFGPAADALPVGIGDDAAVIDLPPGHSLVFCSDLVVENSHFLRGVHPPASIAYRAIAANVSDVAAMGGIATHFVMSLAAPQDLDLDWIESFFDGVQEACNRFEIMLAGGDSAAADRIFVDIAMTGRVRSGQAVRRSGAKAGDGIYVTGSLGSSLLGFERLQMGQMDGAAVRRHLYPEARHRVGAAIASRAHAMTDVSDGLSTDLSHLMQESNVSCRIYKDRLPAWPGASEAHILHGGEEYELLIAAADLPEMVEGIRITRIGDVVESADTPQIVLVDGGNATVLHPRGWEHFRKG